MAATFVLTTGDDSAALSRRADRTRNSDAAVRTRGAAGTGRRVRHPVVARSRTARAHRRRRPSVASSTRDQWVRAAPLAASTFKIASPVSKVTGALFLARLYGIDIGATQILTLLVASILLSVSTPGVPHSWLVILAPMLASVGIPPEGVGLLMAVDVVPDMIFTTLNATGYLAAAAIVAGRSPQQSEAVPVPARDDIRLAHYL